MTDRPPPPPGTAALAYVAKGIAVFPIVPWDAPGLPATEQGKKPATLHGLKDASTDADQVAKWWTTNPHYNIGIPTGERATFWVLDIDGEEGAASLAALEAKHGPLPPTPEQTTSRGRHLCFAYDRARPIRNSASRVGAKIDVRGDGGYIVAAPSRHQSGTFYQWHPERRPSRLAFAAAPDWLIELTKKPEPPPRPAPAPADRKPTGRLISPWGEAILREECDKIRAAVPGTQEVTLNGCAFNVGTVVGAGEIALSIARTELISAGMAIARDWSLSDVGDKVERALQAGILKPREKPALPPRHPHHQPAPIAQAKTTQQEQPDQASATATVVDIRDPTRGYTADTAWERELIVNEEGKIVPRTKNAILMLSHHRDMLGVLAFDTFARVATLLRRPPWELEDGAEWEARALTDNDVTWATAWLESKGLAMKSSVVFSACVATAQRSSFNPAVDWLCDLKWDGKPRLDTWLNYYLGADDRSIVSTMGRKWLIGAVARVLRPGCKMDTMLILEGAQGIGKSKAAKILGTFGPRSYFTDEISDIGSKDAAMQLQGVVIVELAEMNAMERSDINAIKAWLTRTTDRYRPPYGRAVIEAPRQSVLIGTMNPDGSGYFHDATGARRFWPVAVKACDHDALQADQPQLWAEAVHAFRQREPWWLDGDQNDDASIEQEERYADDPWSGAIDDYIGMLASVRIENIMGEGCLKIPAERQSQIVFRRIAKHLKKRGWMRRKEYDQRAKMNKWQYFKPEEQ